MELIFSQESAKQFSKDLLFYRLVGYADSHFAKDPQNQKLVIGYYFILNRAIVPWNCKKQRTVSTSTTKAKYVALEYVARQAI